ncbi:MAG: hydroxymethylpyrimidine/phosphomethylpyrimidine kinase [Burkholderiales bacterium]|nr:hydroxymethylpyrimidine/phosphomethylpyrimidine kinase [Bacteroidia bacterium]
MKYNRPIVLSIAGFDPCGGAGVLADTKTFEQHQCLGMAINTSITNQVEDYFTSVNWFTAGEIIEQVKTLTDKYQIDFVKIGIIENLNVLHEVITFLKQQNQNITIVWDTVLSASSGFNLINTIEKKKLEEILKNIFLITPNTNEAKKLNAAENEMDAANYLASFCNVLLKGGHSDTEKGTDYLFHYNQRIKIQTTLIKELPSKHGSGCILSSAITANLSLGNDLETSCKKAKQYIETILNSNTNLLAYHVA